MIFLNNSIFCRSLSVHLVAIFSLHLNLIARPVDIMSSDFGNQKMNNHGFTIPKKSPPTPSSSASSLLVASPSQAQHPDQATSATTFPPPTKPFRSNRKLLPTRATRTSDASTARMSPEWEGMAKLLSQFHNRADAGKNYFLCSGMIVYFFIATMSHPSYLHHRSTNTPVSAIP